MYKNFVDKINLRVNAILNEIETIYNFDIGDEFEIAMCKLLINFLPEKFGVCRGHIITKNDEQAGDDIIIYDKHRFPILRMLNEDSLWRKQFIPIEAVYAYIEAKNTLYLNGNDNQSLNKAIQQVHLAKSLRRTEKSIGDIDRYIKLPSQITQQQKGWPKIKNPMYGCIISRNIKINKGDENPLKDTHPLHLKCNLSTHTDTKTKYPDLIIAGKNHIIVPAIGSELTSPFLVPGESNLSQIPNVEEKAFGIGLTTLIYALNAIELQDMYWPEIIANAAGLELNNHQE